MLVTPQGEIGDEVGLEAGGAMPPGTLREAYRRWADGPAPQGTWTAVVESVEPATALDAEAGRSRHLRTAAPRSGDLAVLRVYGSDGPVLSDGAFSARRASLEAALGR